MNRPPIPPTLEQAAQRAAEQLRDIGLLESNTISSVTAIQDTAARVILAHVAPCCGVNQELPLVLFRGYEVLERIRLNPRCAARTSAENVGDVLDAVAAIMRQEQSAQTQEKETNEH